MEISLENLYVDTGAYGDQFGEFICGYWGLWRSVWRIYMWILRLMEISLENLYVDTGA